MRRFSYLTFLILAWLFISPNCVAQSTIVIKFSHVERLNSPKGLAANHFKELVEIATKGRVRVDVYANSILYKDNEELEALQLNAVQMIAPSLSKFSALGVREFELFDLPYLFPNLEVAHKITQGQIGRDLLAKLSDKGMIGLAIWDNGFKNIAANKAVHLPSDMNDLRMRIPSSKVLDAQMRALGAKPWSMSYLSMLEKLRTNFIDGTELTTSSFYAQPNNGNQNYFTLTNHGYAGFAIIANKNFWEELPNDIRNQLTNAMIETTKYANNLALKQNELDLIAIQKAGKTSVIELSDAEKEQWHKTFNSIKQQMEGRIGRELLNATLKQVSN